MTQNAALNPLAPAGAPGGAPSPMPQPMSAPWHAAPGTRVSQGTGASMSQGGELAAAPLSSARAEPGLHVAPTQGMQHGVPSAAHGSADAQRGMPPARSPGLGSGPGGDAAEQVVGQPPAASPAGSLADSLVETEARHPLDAVHMHASTQFFVIMLIPGTADVLLGILKSISRGETDLSRQLPVT